MVCPIHHLLLVGRRRLVCPIRADRGTLELEREGATLPRQTHHRTAQDHLHAHLPRIGRTVRAGAGGREWRGLAFELG